MKYIGSKRRLVEDLKPLIENIAYLENIDTYVEPFCGGCNLIEHINIKNKYAYDINEALVCLLNKIKNATEDEINRDFNIINKNTFDKYLHRYFNNYTSINKDDLWKYMYCFLFFSYKSIYLKNKASYFLRESMTKNYLNNYFNKEHELLSTIKTIDVKDYMNINYNRAIIYCDPPYENTIDYDSNIDFRQRDQKLIELAKNNLVFISEYSMNSKYFKLIYSKEIECTIRGSDTARVENVYVVKGGWLVDKYFNDDNDEMLEF